MAFAWLAESVGDEPPLPSRLSDAVDERHWNAMAGVIADPTLSPVTSSMGRLFDAVAALCGLAPRTSYEGQAAVELEAAAARSRLRHGYELQLVGSDSIIDPRELVRAAYSDLESGASVPTVAARFHGSIADATATACASVATARGLDAVVLSGGVFQNRVLLEAVAGKLHDEGLRVLTPLQLPPNDGGISFGQVAVAAARAEEQV
jgi:hydrogenase maturation protein HypF